MSAVSIKCFELQPQTTPQVKVWGPLFVEFGLKKMWVYTAQCQHILQYSFLLRFSTAQEIKPKQDNT